MDVQFSWSGFADKLEGKATYSTGESTFELWLPTFDKAKQLSGILQDVFEEGRRAGCREIMRDVGGAMNAVARRVL